MGFAAQLFFYSHEFLLLIQLPPIDFPVSHFVSRDIQVTFRPSGKLVTNEAPESRGRLQAYQVFSLEIHGPIQPVRQTHTHWTLLQSAIQWPVTGSLFSIRNVILGTNNKRQPTKRDPLSALSDSSRPPLYKEIPLVVLCGALSLVSAEYDDSCNNFWSMENELFYDLSVVVGWKEKTTKERGIYVPGHSVVTCPHWKLLGR